MNEGLRERKKRLLRQQLSDTATRMFLDHGFDAVRITEIAEAAGVSEKTVYNYFPTKESLILDRFDTTATALPPALRDTAVPPVEAALRILEAELSGLTSALTAEPDPAGAVARFRRFGQLLHSTPSLRTHQRDSTERLIALAAQALAERAGLDQDAPEPRIAAVALLELWQIQFSSLHRHLGGPLADLHAAVVADVRRAANLIASGLDTFDQRR